MSSSSGVGGPTGILAFGLLGVLVGILTALVSQGADLPRGELRTFAIAGIIVLGVGAPLCGLLGATIAQRRLRRRLKAVRPSELLSAKGTHL